MASSRPRPVAGHARGDLPLLKPGQVGLLHTRRKRPDNGRAALVLAVGRKGVVFRIANGAESGTLPLFEDLYVSWKRFDFVFVDAPKPLRAGGEPLLLFRMMGLDGRSADDMRLDATDPRKARLLRRFMRVAPLRAKVYLAKALDAGEFGKLAPSSESGDSKTTRALKGALYEEPGSGRAAKRRFRALALSLAKRSCRQQAYDAWLLNPDLVSHRFALRLMRALAKDEETHDLRLWKTSPNYARHWTAALLGELCRRHLEVVSRGGLHDFSGLVVRLLREGQVKRKEWLTTFPNARQIAEAAGCRSRAKFWQFYMEAAKAK